MTAIVKPIAATLAKMRGKFDQRQRLVEDEYTAAVRVAAEGKKEIDPDRIIAILDKLDRDPADFQADVESLCQRFEFQAAAALLPAHQARKSIVEGTIASAETKFADSMRKIVAERDSILGPALLEIVAAEKLIALAVTAGQELQESAPCDIKARVTQAAAALREANAHHAAMVSQVRRLDIEPDPLVGFTEVDGEYSSRVEIAIANRNRHVANVEELRGQIPEAKARQVEAQAAYARASAELLVV